MTNVTFDDLDRRVVPIEKKFGIIDKAITDQGKAVARLEESEDEAKRHREKVEKALWRNGSSSVVATLARIEQKVDNRSEGNNKGNDKVTFKWMAERFGVPFLLLVLGTTIGILINIGG